MPEPEEAAPKKLWARSASLRKNVLGVVGAIGLVVGAVLGIIQLLGWLGGVGREPIRADYSFVNSPAEGVIVGGFDPEGDPQRYLREGLVAFSYPYVWVEVTSQADSETVTLPPYLVVEVSNVRPMPANANYVVYPTGGGGAQLTVFVATLSPEREGVFYAPQWTRDAALGPRTPGYNPDVRDTFTLTPGAKEFFRLDVTMLPGYYYDLRVGVQYSYQDSQRVVWSEEEVVVGVPLDAEVWGQTEDGQGFQRFGDLQSYEAFKEKEDTSLLPPSRRYGRQEVRKAIEKQDETVQQYQYPFTPPERLSEPEEG